MEHKPSQIRHSEGSPWVTGIVSSNIELEQLSLYQQAAESTGFKISISARPGEPFIFWHPGDEEKGIKGGMRTMTLPEGNLGITITKPSEQKDHSAFWQEYAKLAAEQNPPK